MQHMSSNSGNPIVDVESHEDDGDELPARLILPAIRVCEEFINGMLDMDVARGAVMHTVLKKCFSDGCS